MKKKERWFSVKTKMYIFAIFPMLIVTFGISTIAFIISNDQIDNFYKQNASDNAVNFASMVDGDFMKVLRATVESDEYQSIREKAIEKENEQLIEDYLKEKGLWVYIKGCCHMICEVFKHSPVYRLGGDEFVVILTGSDYDNRKELFDKLRADFAESSSLEDVDPWLRFSAATGMAENASDDVTAELVFKRADKAMYENKTKFKSEHGAYR